MVSKGKTKKKTNETIKRELLNLSKEMMMMKSKDLMKQSTMSTTLKKQYSQFVVTRTI